MPSSDSDGITPRRPVGGRPGSALRFDIGDRILHFRILASLGRGGMGQVFQARDELLGRDVALKFVSPDARSTHALIRLQREAEAARQINHQNVVVVFELARYEGEPFIVAEYIRGDDLSSLIRNGLPPVAAATAILRQIAAGLEAAHAAGVVHRDIKPQNILRRHEDSSIVIVDFGLGKIFRTGPDAPVDTAITNATDILGTTSYMAPEQFEDPASVSEKADVFSFGVLAFELLTTQRPFDGANAVMTMDAIRHATPPDARSIRDDIPVVLSELIRECLNKDPQARPTAAEIVARLTAHSSAQPTYPARVSAAVADPWPNLLHRIVDGPLSMDVEEYVRLVFRNAPDPAVAESEFFHALDRELMAWRPRLTDDLQRTDAFLKLLAIYVPPSGFAKVCELLETDAVSPEETAIALRALAVLEQYFPAPPPDGASGFAFRHYVRILTNLVASETLAAHAAARLIELGVADASNEQIRRKALLDAVFLTELVSYFVSPIRHHDYLRAIFDLCSDVGAPGLRTFLSAVERSGGTAILEPDRVSVRNGDKGPAFLLQLYAPRLDEYMIARWHLLANDRSFLNDLFDDSLPGDVP